MCMPGAYGNQKRASDPLGLELQVVVSHRMRARNRLKVLCRAANALNHRAISPASHKIVFN